MAKFAVNNYVNASTGMIPFFVDHGFHPCTCIEPPGMFDGEGEQKAELLTADKIVAQQEKIMSFLQDQLTWS